MKITALTKQQKSPDRISIFVDGKYGFSLTLDEIVDQKIKTGMEIDQAELKRFKKLSADGKMKARALNWLLNRAHSSREFQDYMRRKKADPQLTAKLEIDFKKKGYLDDANYARWLIDLRGRAGKSNRAIRAELFKKGVARELIDSEMADDSTSEDQRLKAVAAKKSKLPRYRSDPQKLAQYLLRQGFNYQQVKEALKITAAED